MQTPDFRISKSNLVQVSDTLSTTNASGATVPMDLTGSTVQFVFQLKGPGAALNFSGSATITDPVNGKVSYTFTAGQTDEPGLYEGQWVVTSNANVVTNFPTGSLDDDDDKGRFILFEIVDVIPRNPEAGITLVSDTYDCVRAILGDHDDQFRKYEDQSIARVVRAILLCGQLPIHGSTVGYYGLTPNRLGITPAVTIPVDFGSLIYQAAKRLFMPDSAEYSYRTRAMSEKFGEQKSFIQDLENAIYDLRNGSAGVFLTFQSFYGWVNALSGVNVWSAMTDMTTRAPVANVIIGRGGIQVNTT